MKHQVGMWFVLCCLFHILSIVGCSSEPTVTVGDGMVEEKMSEPSKPLNYSSELPISSEQSASSKQPQVGVKQPTPIDSEECDLEGRNATTEKALLEIRKAYNYGFLPCRQLGIKGKADNAEEWWLVFKKESKLVQLQKYDGEKYVSGGTALNLEKENLSLITLIRTVRNIVKIARPAWNEEATFKAFYPATDIVSDVVIPMEKVNGNNIKGRHYTAIDKTQVYWSGEITNNGEKTNSIVVRLNDDPHIPLKAYFRLQK